MVQMVLTQISAAVFLLCYMTGVSARPQPTHGTVDIASFRNREVSELCKEVKDKATLQAMIDNNIAVKSEVFETPFGDDRIRHTIDFCYGVHVAMRHNWPDMVNQYVKSCGMNSITRLYFAIWGSHLNYYKYLLGDPNTFNAIVQEAGSHNPLPTIHRNIIARHMHRSGPKDQTIYATVKEFNGQFFDFAAWNGELDLLQSFNSPDLPPQKFAIVFASRNGKLEVVHWLHLMFYGKNHCSSGAFLKAAENGRLDVVKYLYGQCDAQFKKDKNTSKAFGLAAGNKHVQVVQYLYQSCNEDPHFKAEAEKMIGGDVNTWLKSQGIGNQQGGTYRGTQPNGNQKKGILNRFFKSNDRQKNK
jgi:hypothetical protein